MEQQASFLGQGWSFPPVFSKASKEVLLVKDQQDIEESLAILLSTSLGERVMQPLYGCNLGDMVFETLNTSTLAFIKDMVSNSILYFEPRIKTEGIEISTASATEGIILIRINYQIRVTNSRYNFVYPFYLKEGNVSKSLTN